MTIRKYRFLSWGLGVQSTWLLVMAGLGEIEPLDAVITADTQWEQKRTYEIYNFYKAWAEQHGMPVISVTAGSIREHGVEGHVHMPLFTDSGAPLSRQCTPFFKLTPLKRAMRRFAGYDETKRPHPKQGQFETCLGISWDEWSRMSTSDVKYIVNRYPLVEKHINRWDCVDGFKRLGLPVPGKSACIGCPYRDAVSWLDMKTNSPEDFADAVAFDKKNRDNPLKQSNGSTADKLYVWRDLIPLDQVDFETEAKKAKLDKQTSLFVCTGNVCWT